MVTIIPTPYIGQGLLGDDERNNILGSFAGGLLQGFTVNPTPVMGQYFTPIGGGTRTVTGGMQDQATELTPDEFAQMMQDYQNEQNLLNESSFADDIGPEEAEPPSMEVSSLGELLGNLVGGYYDDEKNFLGGFKQLYDILPQGKLMGLLTGSNVDSVSRSFKDGYEYTGFSDGDELGEGMFDDFDADMQAEE